METVANILTGAAALVEGLINQAHFSSMLLGFVLSFGLTQWIKGFVRLKYYHRAANPHDLMTEEESLARYKLVIRSIATIVGTIATWATWPGGPLTQRTIWALAVGAAAPTVYWILVRMAARRWPEVAEYVSADSRLPGARQRQDDNQ